MSRVARGYTWSEEAKEAFSKRQRFAPNRSKFTVDDILEIRKKRSDGVSCKELAVEYNTTSSYISSIVLRRRWSHI